MRVGRVQTGTATPVALDLSGTILYVGTDSSLLTLDASNPGSLTQLASLPLASLTSLAHTGTTLYAGTLDGHLLVFDVTQPAAPVQQLSILLPAVADKLLVSGNFLLIADDTAGLLIYDVSTPATPALVTHLTLPGAAADLALDGTLALLASADAGLVIVDVSNPATPAIVSQTALDMPVNFGEKIQHNLASCIAIQNSIAYVGTVSDNDTLFAFDYRQPAHPRLVSLASYVFSISGGVGLDGALLTLLTSGNRLFIGGVLELDTPVIEADITQPRNAINLYLSPASLLPPFAPLSGLTAAPRGSRLARTPVQWRKNLLIRLKKPMMN